MTDTEIKDTNFIKRFFGRNWSWLAAATITAVFMLAMMIGAKVAPFGETSFTLVDSIHQYVPFFSDYQDKLVNGGSLKYTWDVGMGQNFQSLFLYYMACPLNLLLFFVKRKNIIALFSLLVAFKFAFSSGAFAYFLSRRRGKVTNNMMIVALGVAFSLNNYMCGYYWNIMWLDCIMVFPLIMLGFERLMKNGDMRLYSVALFYSMYCNYYISFIICIFLCLWFIFTGHKNPKKFITDGLKFAGSSLLAAGMATISLLTAYLAIMKTATAKTPMPKWNWYQNFFQLLQSHFFLSKPIKMNTFDGDANLYCGTLCLIALFIFVCSDKVKLGEKIGKCILILIFIISMNQEKLNFIWHGFHNQFGIPNRFSFLYIFTLLVICYETVVKLRKTSLVSVSVGIVLTALFLGLCYHFGDMKGVIPERYMMMVSFGLIVVYAIIIIARCTRFMSVKANTIILGIYVIVEILVNAGLGIGGNGYADGHYYMQHSDTMQSAVSQIKEKSDKEGRLFYREDVVDPIMMDENTYCNMRSIGTFCSTVRGDMVQTMSYMGYYTGANEFLFLGSNPVTNDMFGIRYVYVRNGDYYPGTQYMDPVVVNEKMTVYENKYALPLMYGVRRNIDNWTYETNNSAMVLNHFANYAAGVKDDIYETERPVLGVVGNNCVANYDSDSPTVISYSEGKGKTISITITFTAEKSARYFVNARANYVDKVTYSLNGLKQASGRYQSQLLDLGDVKEGDLVQLDMDFNENYTPSGSITMFISSVNEDALAQFRGQMTKNAAMIKTFEDDYVKADITLDDNQYIFTSVPYDEGWKVYVDGKEVEPFKVAGAFIAIEADAGKHTVEMKYFPPGMKAGIIGSSVCWIMYLALFVYITKKSKNKSKNKETTN